MVWLFTTLAFLFVGLFIGHIQHKQKTNTRNYNYSTIGYWHVLVWGFIGALVVGPLASLVFVSQTSYHHREPVDQPIASLGDTTGVSGRFFLGSGYVDSYPVYYFYVQNGNGGYEIQEIKASLVDIRYTTGQPHLTLFCHDWTQAADWAYLPGWKWGSKPDNIWHDGCVNTDGGSTAFDVYGTFYVPEGSVKNDYTLDAQ